MTNPHRVDVLQPLGGWDPVLASWPQVSKALAAARAARRGTRPRRPVRSHQLTVATYRPRRSVAPLVCSRSSRSGQVAADPAT